MGLPPGKRWQRGRPRLVVSFVLLLGGWLFAAPAQAFRVFDLEPADAIVAVRWDAAPRSVETEERSLAGGLRYSLEGGSYQAFRDQFTWLGGAPSVASFQATVDGAFDAWTVTDPASGLGSALSFVPDLGTPVVDQPGDLMNPASFIGLNAGAEIDVIAEIPHLGPGYGGSVRFFLDGGVTNDLTLTSGTIGYAGAAISGADIRINPTLLYTLDEFGLLLSHEIGHAIGLGDVELFPGVGGVNSLFLDDDFDGSTSATALATLTNSFVHDIDPLDPDSSPLLRVPGTLAGDPGLGTPGVEILMESGALFDLLGAEGTLQNDDFAGRQYLYPVVPEPSTFLLVSLGLGGLAASRRRTTGRPSALT